MHLEVPLKSLAVTQAWFSKKRTSRACSELFCSNETGGKKYQFHAYLRLNYIPRLGHRTSNVHEILSNNHIKVENGEEAYRVRWQSVTLTWVPLCDSLHALQSRGDLN